jgi:hypothetical protein
MPDNCEHERIITDLFNEIQLLNIGPYNYWYTYFEEAVYCFLKKHYIASVLVSSATVETVLFWEYVRKKYESIKDVVVLEQTPKGKLKTENLTLSLLFNEFVKTEIPLTQLLEENEREFFRSVQEIGDKNKRRSALGRLKFIETRNKFAHADLFGTIAKLKTEQFKNTCRNFNQPYLRIEELENTAYSQLH